jgi:HSP20 family molecular chaperone IbpA
MPPRVLAPKFDVFEIDSSGEGGSESSAVAKSVTGWLLIGDVPGVRPEDVKIAWTDETIIFIRGMVPGATAHTLDSWEGFRGIEIAHLKPLRRQRKEGSFERSVSLPEKVKVKNVDIAVQDGLVLVKVLRET